MSGGHFNYVQYRLEEVVESIQRIIKNNNDSLEKDEFGCDNGYNFSPDVIAKMKETIKIVELAEKMITYVDLLVSSDYGEDSFMNDWMNLQNRI